MLRLINDITDLPNWHEGANDFSVCQSWKGDSFLKYVDGTFLWEWCMFELRKKATEFQRSSQSIAIFDSASSVLKSDRLINSSLLRKLQQATLYIHLSPWLHVFSFGQTPILANGSGITLEAAVKYVGSSSQRLVLRHGYEHIATYAGELAYYSNIGSWIATEIKFTGDDNQVKITTPINNLHPYKYSFIYRAIEDIISHSIEDWNRALLYKTTPREPSRIKPQQYQCYHCSGLKDPPCSCRIDLRPYSAWLNGKEDNEDREFWSEAFWNPVIAMDGGYANSRKLYDNISLSKAFAKRGLQVYIEIERLEVKRGNEVKEESSRCVRYDQNLFHTTKYTDTLIVF